MSTESVQTKGRAGEPTAPERGPSEFERQASEASRGFIMEFFRFLAENRKWWLLPIVFLLVLVGGLALLTSGVLAPLIYPLF